MRPVYLLVCLSASLAAAPTARADSRTVDGDPSEWLAAHLAFTHTAHVNGDQWIYVGERNDHRADTGSTASADLVELNLAADETYLYVLARFASVTRNEVYLSLGFDFGNDTGQDFLGDGTGLVYGAAELRTERQIAFHVAGSGMPEAEWYSSSNWYSIPATEVEISETHDCLEARIPLEHLASLSPTGTFRLSAATFVNAGGWNNDTDTTLDFATNDALDSLGHPGDTGVSSWERELSDSDIDQGWVVTLHGSGAPTATEFSPTVVADAGIPDAAVPLDAGVADSSRDTGTPVDTGAAPDARPSSDAATSSDAGGDATSETGARDAASDTSFVDATLPRTAPTTGCVVSARQAPSSSRSSLLALLCVILIVANRVQPRARIGSSTAPRVKKNVVPSPSSDSIQIVP